MKKILIITQEIPYPLTTGGRQGVFHFIDKLRDEYEIAVLFPLFFEADKSSLKYLEERWKNVKFYPFHDSISATIPKSKLSKLYNGLHDFRFAIRKLLKRKNTVIHASDPVRDRSTLSTSISILNWRGYVNYISEVVKNDFDIIQVEFYDFISLVHVLPSRVEKIFVHHELRYIRNSIEMSFFKEIYPYDRYMFDMSKQYELDTLKLYDKIITVTDIDRDKLQIELPTKAIFSSSLMVNIPDNIPDYKYEFNNKLTFVASSSHFPNLDGVKWFLSEVWIILQKKYPALELHLIGKGWMPEMFKNLNLSNVYFDGYVEDLGLVLPNTITIVPIRIGSGMRMKILEAVHYKIPFVTTTVGVEGLSFADGQDCYIADKPENFAEAIATLIDNEDKRQDFIHNAYVVLQNAFNNESLVDRRRFIYEANSN